MEKPEPLSTQAEERFLVPDLMQLVMPDLMLGGFGGSIEKHLLHVDWDTALEPNESCVLRAQLGEW